MAQDDPTIGDSGQSAAAAFNAAQLKTESLKSTWYGATAPPTPVEGMQWWNGTTLKIRKGAAWELVTPGIQGATVDATSSVDGVAVFVAEADGTVSQLRLLPIATIAVDGSDYYSAQVDNVTETLDLFATAPGTDSDAWTIGVPEDMAPDQNQTVSAGDVLRVTISGTGSPAAITSLGVQLTIQYS